jgi:hypothetical protein
MTEEEWHASVSARDMLAKLHDEQPHFLETQIPQLHKFLIACCWKHQNLIPQEGLRNGLRGAERWIAGEIDDDELNRLDYHAEADVFAIAYVETADDISFVKSLIHGIVELRELPFESARKQLLDAAYFAECSMIYPMLSSAPWSNALFNSQFLCPNLLRDNIKPHFCQ